MKKILFLLCITMLTSCGSNTKNSTNISSSSKLTTQSTTSSLSNSSTTSLFPFDNRILGTWYLAQSNTGLLVQNTIFKVEADYVLIQNIKFYYEGQYENFEAYIYWTENKQQNLILGYDEEHNYVDYAYQSLYSGNYDFGFLQDTPLQEGPEIEYQGPEWPIEKVNKYINTNGTIPIYEADEYILDLFTSSLNDKPCAMIEIVSTTNEDLLNYINLLNSNGYNMQKNNNSNFYEGNSEDEIYYLRIIRFDEGNLDIFIYNFVEYNI